MLVKIALALLVSASTAQAGETFRGLTPQNQAPACTDALLTIPSSGADYRTSAGCPTVVKMSQYGIVSDTSGLETIAPTAGSDQTTAIQAVFDLNKISGTPLVIIDDVKATVGVLTINSYTSLVCTQGSGFLLKVNGPGPILSNSTPTYGNTTATPYYRTVGGFGNTDISIGDGCVFNEQRANQNVQTYPNPNYSNGIPAAIRMYGVQNLTIGAVRIYSNIWFGILMANVQHVRINNALVDASPLAHGGRGSSTFGVMTDGIHTTGPATDGIIFGSTVHAQDDPIAINADDGDGVNALCQTLGDAMYACVGDITDWHVRGLTLSNGVDGTVGQYGVGILSAFSRVDNVTVEDVSGQTCDDWLHVWTDQPNTPVAGNGNIGHIVFHGPGPEVTCSTPGGGNAFAGDMTFNASATTISIYDYFRQNPVLNKPMISLGVNTGEIQMVNITQNEVTPDTGYNYPAPLISVLAGVGELSILHATSFSNATPVCKPIVSVASGANIIRLHANNIYVEGGQCAFTVASGGTLFFGRWDGSMTATGGSYAPLANAGTVGYWWDNSAAFNAVSGEGYTGTAPTHYNSGAPTTYP